MPRRRGTWPLPACSVSHSSTSPSTTGGAPGTQDEATRRTATAQGLASALLARKHGLLHMKRQGRVQAPGVGAGARAGDRRRSRHGGGVIRMMRAAACVREGLRRASAYHRPNAHGPRRPPARAADRQCEQGRAGWNASQPSDRRGDAKGPAHAALFRTTGEARYISATGTVVGADLGGATM